MGDRVKHRWPNEPHDSVSNNRKKIKGIVCYRRKCHKLALLLLSITVVFVALCESVIIMSVVEGESAEEASSGAGYSSASQSEAITRTRRNRSATSKPQQKGPVQTRAVIGSRRLSKQSSLVTGQSPQVDDSLRSPTSMIAALPSSPATSRPRFEGARGDDHQQSGPQVVVASRWQSEVYLPCRIYGLDEDQTVSC